MSGTSHVDRARRMLEEQIEGIGVIRNGSTRDQAFKSWRQNTLTAIQRLWPADPTKGERFRRVPFSPPSSKADARVTREFLERGCAEAQAYLRGLIVEIELNGLPDSYDAPGPASLAPGVAEDDFPTLDLPGGPARASAPRPAAPQPAHATGAPALGETPSSPPSPPPVAVSDSLTPMLDLPRVSPPGASDIDEPPPPRAAVAEEPVPDRPRATRGGRGGRDRAGKVGRAKPGRQRLKDMLGFGDDEARASAPPSAPPIIEPTPPALEPVHEPEPVLMPMPEPTPELMPDAMPEPMDLPADMPVGRPADAPPLMHGPPPLATTAGPLIPTLPPPVHAIAPVEPEPVEAEPSAEEPPALDQDGFEPNEVEVENVTEDFLRTSPVFSSLTRPAARRPSAVPSFDSPAALTVAAIAADIESFAVPEGQRAQARAALLDLAQRIEHHDFTWDSLRDAVAFAMEYPALARRVLPLVVPYLDQAA